MYICLYVIWLIVFFVIFLHLQRETFIYVQMFIEWFSCCYICVRIARIVSKSLVWQLPTIQHSVYYFDPLLWQGILICYYIININNYFLTTIWIIQTQVLKEEVSKVPLSKWQKNESSFSSVLAKVLTKTMQYCNFSTNQMDAFLYDL